MAPGGFKRALFLALLGVVVADQFNGLSIVTVQVFKPKGFRAFIPDVANLAFFAIKGISKRGDTNFEILGETTSPVDNVWIVDLPDVQLSDGDELDFLVFAAVNSTGYIRDKIQHRVTEAELKPYVPIKRSSTNPNPCEPTITRVRQGTVCAGQTIFEEHFDFLREEIWQVQQYVPVNHPELPFVSYQPSAVTVKDGNLRIAPSEQQNQPGYQATSSLYTHLDLTDGCTAEAGSCYVSASDGYTIIPPVISGRVTSKFAFTYGTIIVRAKLPQGDWIYPEILLEPLIQKFAYQSQNSGILKIACARGNMELTKDSVQYGNKVLYGGPVIDTTCHDNLLRTKMSQKFWGDSFHEYSVKWTPESLILSVDGEEYATVKPSKGDMNLPAICHRASQTDMKPFNDHFYITLGLAVGGRSEFPDSSTTGNHSKPWRNVGAKATVNFWNDLEAWRATWRQAELLVDYVKVVAV